MAVALLDVNVLVALFHEGHVHHEIAHDWFADNAHGGWASCPLTENGLVRILGNPARIEQHVPIARVVELLSRFCDHSKHHFWRDDVSLRNTALVNAAEIRGHQQISDVYLLGLAVKHGGRLATFDAGVPLGAVKGARREHLAVITPDAATQAR
jgi:uncharacterized protein